MSKTILGCIPSEKFRVIHRSLLFDAVKERRYKHKQEKKGLLEQILAALKTPEEKTRVEESSKDLVDENKEGEDVNGTSENLVEKSSENTVKKNKEGNNPVVEEDKTAESEKVSKILVVLEKLEQVHREQREDLLEANQDLKEPGVTKVIKMEKKIQNSNCLCGRDFVLKNEKTQICNLEGACTVKL